MRSSIFFAAQKQLQFPVAEGLLQIGQFLGHVLQRALVLLLQGQLQEDFQVLHLFDPLLPLLQGLDECAPLLENLRGPGLVLPELGLGHQFFQMPQPGLFPRQIKDDLGGAPGVIAILSIYL